MANKREVKISYRAEDGTPITYSGEMSDDDIAILIKQLDGEPLEEIVEKDSRFWRFTE